MYIYDYWIQQKKIRKRDNNYVRFFKITASDEEKKTLQFAFWLSLTALK
jgi:hypothetical protein